MPRSIRKKPSKVNKKKTMKRNSRKRQNKGSKNKKKNKTMIGSGNFSESENENDKNKLEKYRENARRRYIKVRRNMAGQWKRHLRML